MSCLRPHDKAYLSIDSVDIEPVYWIYGNNDLPSFIQALERAEAGIENVKTGEMLNSALEFERSHLSLTNFKVVEYSCNNRPRNATRESTIHGMLTIPK